MIESFVIKTLSLLKLEHETEVLEIQSKLQTESPQQCEVLGLSILNLNIQSVSTSLYGRNAIELISMSSRLLPSTFKVGDEVQLKFSPIDVGGDDYLDGIVTKTSSTMIEITVENIEMIESINPPIRLNRRASEVTFKKLSNCLERMSNKQDHSLIKLLLNDSKDIIPEPDRIVMKFSEVQATNLNPSQVSAIERSLSPSSFVSLIHGPPGTGKTATLTELILQAVKLGQKILVCAPSNAAVDNLLDRIIKHESSKGIKCIRLGHPARMDSNLLNYCLDAQISECEGQEIISDIKREIDTLRKVNPKRLNSSSVSSKHEKSEGLSIQEERRMSRKERQIQLKQLQRDLRKYEKKILRDLIHAQNIIFSTCVGASSSLIRDVVFDLIVVDEAAQAIEVETWIPILLGKRVVLAGDPNQLPPTIKSTEAMSQGFSVSLLERLMRQNGGQSYRNVIYLLDTQYRMNQTICTWASQAMYQSQLHSHESAANRSLNDWMSQSSFASSKENNSYSVLTLVDTSGCDFDEFSTITGSRYNETEAEVVRRYVVLLLKAGAKPSDIGIISPYNGQVSYIRSLFASGENKEYIESLESISIRTVDGFQGGEKEIIILSLVRSNISGDVGFLSDKRRINVAITRAKRHLAVIGDVMTCSENEFMRDLLDYMSRHGDHRSAMEFLHDGWLQTSLTYEPMEFNNEVTTNESQIEQIEGLPANHNIKSKSHERQKAKPKTSTSSQRLGNTDDSKSEEAFRVSLTELLSSFVSYSPLPIKALNQCSAKHTSMNILVFSKELSSYMRRCIHEVCEQYPSLTHESDGDGSLRQLSIIRPSEPALLPITEIATATKKNKTATEKNESYVKQTDTSASKSKNGKDKTPSSVKVSGVNTIGSLDKPLSDEEFTDVINEALSLFSSYESIPIDLLSKLSAMMSSSHSIMFSTRLQPHRRMIVQQASLSYQLLSYEVVGLAHQLQIRRPKDPSLNQIQTNVKQSSQYSIIDTDEQTDDSRTLPQVTTISSTAKESESHAIVPMNAKKELPVKKTKVTKESALEAAIHSNDISEDEVLRLAMEERKAYEKEHQFRVKSSPFPNNEKIQRQKYLHAVLQDASNSRKAKIPQDKKSKK